MLWDQPEDMNGILSKLIKILEAYIMDDVEKLLEQIEKTKVILAESQENYKNNPDSYSARLLLMSTEAYLADLLRELDLINDQK